MGTVGKGEEEKRKESRECGSGTSGDPTSNRKKDIQPAVQNHITERVGFIQGG